MMQRIRDCGDESNKYESIGWACIGSAVTALFSAITFVASVDFERTLPAGGTGINWWKFGVFAVCLAATAAGWIGGWLSLHYAKQHRKDRADLRRIILEDMQFIEDMHPLVTAPPSPPASPPDQATAMAASESGVGN